MPEFFGPGSGYFSCQEAGLSLSLSESESARDGGPVARPTVDVITPA